MTNSSNLVGWNSNNITAYITDSSKVCIHKKKGFYKIQLIAIAYNYHGHDHFQTKSYD